MKGSPWFNKSYFNILLIILIIGTSAFSFPSIKVFSAGEPTVTIESPTQSQQLSSTNVIISGTYTADVPKADLLFTIYDNENKISDSSLAGWVIDDTNNNWSFSSSSLAEGTHTIRVEIEKISTQDKATATIDFSIKLPTAIVEPAIKVTSPTSSEVLSSKDVVISGTYSTDAVKSDLQFTLYDNGTKISDSLANSSAWTIDETRSVKQWNFSTKTLEEGNHAISVEIKNKLTNDTAIANTAFTLALTRPFIGGTKIILPDNTELNGEDLTYVPLNAKIKMTVADDQPMNQLKSKIVLGNYNPVKVILGTNTIKGTTEIGEPVSQNGKYYYDITFTPTSGELQNNKTYLVYLDPELVDDLDNPVFTKFFKLTTKANSDWDELDDQKHASSNPHGHYMLNTNMCASCHSTHNNSPYDKLDGKSKITPSREGGTYLIDFNEQLNGNDSQNYCMACHDGTTNAPVIDGITSQYHHDNPVEYSSTAENNLKEASSCTSCHNPHLEWSQDNPNLLKDHYVYNHNSEDQEKMGDTPLTVDSLDKSCDSCHDNTIDFSAIPSDKGIKELLQYNKSFTAVASKTDKFNVPTDLDVPKKTISDYSLCLRCHNLEKKKQKKVNSDIESYYLDSNSGHNFTLLDHAITQRDGSSLNGPIPCADCHETHGSNNLFNLKEILGNNPSITDKYSTLGKDWNVDNERRFCLQCHDKGIELYGKNASIDQTITGHQDMTKACSSCHSDNSKTYANFREQSMSAAHAPLNYKP